MTTDELEAENERLQAENGHLRDLLGAACDILFSVSLTCDVAGSRLDKCREDIQNELHPTGDNADEQ